MTSAGTLHLAQMEYFPCRCEACAKTSPHEVRSRPINERTRFLGEHNLSACLQEIETIKEAIIEGRLWELLEVRCRSHPSLLEGFRRIGKHRANMIRYTPSTKRKGIFYFDSTSLQRPEYGMYLEKLTRDYEPPKGTKVALLLPAAYHGSGSRESMHAGLTSADRDKHVFLYAPPYGIVPSELEETFPFIHTEIPREPDPDTLKAMAEAVRVYFTENKSYRSLIVVHANKDWQKRFARMCGRICRSMGLRFSICRVQRPSAIRTEILVNQMKYADERSKRKLIGR